MRRAFAQRVAPWAHLLGVVSDMEIERRSGLPHRTISKYRRRVGIPSVYGAAADEVVPIKRIEHAVVSGGLQPVWRIAKRLGYDEWTSMSTEARARLRTALAYLVTKGRIQRVSRGVFAPPDWVAPEPAPRRPVAAAPVEEAPKPRRVRRQPERHTGDPAEPARAVPFALRAYL